MITYGGVTLSNVGPYEVDYAPVVRERQLVDGRISLQGSRRRRVGWTFDCRAADEDELAALAALRGQRCDLIVDDATWSGVLIAPPFRRIVSLADGPQYTISFVEDIGASIADAPATGTDTGGFLFDGCALSNVAPYEVDYSPVANERRLVGGGVAVHGASRTRNAWEFRCHTTSAAEVAALALRIGQLKTLTIGGVDYPDCMIAPPFYETVDLPGQHAYTISFLQETYAK